MKSANRRDLVFQHDAAVSRIWLDPRGIFFIDFVLSDAMIAFVLLVAIGFAC